MKKFKSQLREELKKFRERVDEERRVKISVREKTSIDFSLNEETKWQEKERQSEPYNFCFFGFPGKISLLSMTFTRKRKRGT